MTIQQFRDQYDFLSNFSPAPIWYQGTHYPTTEHAFQATKTLDLELRKHIANAPTPGIAKRMGRKLEIRPDWETIKNQVMYEICWLKFTTHPILRQSLLATGQQELEEGNTWGDTYWGKDLRTKTGQNTLGRILMIIREQLRKAEESLPNTTGSQEA